MGTALGRAIDICKLFLPFCAHLSCRVLLYCYQTPRSVAFRISRMNAKRRPKR